MENLHAHNTLRSKYLGIDTYRENIVYLRADSPVCRCEGFTALTRIVVHHGESSIVATLNVVHSELLDTDEAGLSMEAMKRLSVGDSDPVTVSHLEPIGSLSHIRAKMHRYTLTEQQLCEIIEDIVAGKYSNVELAAFLSVSSGNNLTTDEIVGLTKAMVATGQEIRWRAPMVMDKHCIGGLPGNRTTPIVISIIAAAGLTIPKTSSRSITSPAGTADTMEVMTNVELDIERMKEVVSRENACLVWGGAVSLSPADDVLITVSKALDIDSEGQMIASVLSKKKAAGATHVVIDIPVGRTAKVRDREHARSLISKFEKVGHEIDIIVKCLITDGSQPVGRGIGPALEAMDVLGVLRNEGGAPTDLKNRALLIAGVLLELSGKVEKGSGANTAAGLLEDGSAYSKFMAICEAQGRFMEPGFAAFRRDVIALKSGTVISIDCRRLAKLAKLAGAPTSPNAGILFVSPLGRKITGGDVLFTVYAESQGELEYALHYYYKNQSNLIQIL
ncbi:thymidine phosphorylase family protein [Parapedobacter sp. ISTM3]|uniref:thymidine phosphorylase family protein n=1 Tax=Parapedobacter sp. ISTM3 TaxID=2800130 RepID=UPI001906B5A8|nr:thymidine phosphorylase family protein [Parapedobacter sp. ISTM3]MBK1439869.1 thymidine phosphorylase family protein [Parapedobacter sp. ISTM3]